MLKLSFANFPFSKKGYMITPIIFVAFLLISVAFSFYVSDIDESFSRGIITASSIEKSINDIYEMQADQSNIAKLLTYSCSAYYCYPGNETLLKSCVSANLTARYNQTGWDVNMYNQTGNYFITFKLSQFNATNINIASDRINITQVLSKDFLKTC